MVISNDPIVNLIIRIAIAVVSFPIILIVLLGSGVALVYSFFAAIMPIAIFLLITKNKKNRNYVHTKTPDQCCTKCGEKVTSSNNYCAKCGATVN